MRHELRLFFTALSYFTRIPCGSWAGTSEDDLRGAVRHFPLVGVLVGLAAALVFMLAVRVFPQDVAVILSMIATLLLTGAYHEDGLSDAADGLGGGWTREQALTIMRDSRIGNYGAITLVMALLIKYATLSHLPPAAVPAVLVAGHAASRFAAALLIRFQVYVRASGKGRALTQPLSTGGLLWAGVCGLAPLGLLSPSWLWAIVPVALAGLWFAGMLQRRLGGYTGDCLGAMQQLCELTFYLGVLACNSI